MFALITSRVERGVLDPTRGVLDPYRITANQNRGTGTAPGGTVHGTDMGRTATVQYLYSPSMICFFHYFFQCELQVG